MNDNKKIQIKYVVFGIVTTILLILIDQITKYSAVIHLKQGNNIEMITGIFELQYLENHGAAFGMLQNQRAFLLIITIFIIGLIAWTGIFKIPQQKKYVPLHAVLIFLLSGAVGNMIDRIMLGYVVDFFFFKLINFPIFNVADCYVVLAAILGILLVFFYYKEEDFDAMKKGGR